MHIARHKKERYSFFSCKHHGSLIRYNVRFVRNADIVCQCPINVADEDTSKESTRGRIAGEKRRGAYAESENFFWSDFVLKKLSLSLSLSLPFVLVIDQISLPIFFLMFSGSSVNPHSSTSTRRSIVRSDHF